MLKKVNHVSVGTGRDWCGRPSFSSSPTFHSLVVVKAKSTVSPRTNAIARPSSILPHLLLALLLVGASFIAPTSRRQVAIANTHA
jgi:hypothetical protein